MGKKAIGLKPMNAGQMRAKRRDDKENAALKVHFDQPSLSESRVFMYSFMHCSQLRPSAPS